MSVEDTQVAEDTATDTSTNEEALDTEAELENDDTSFEDSSDDDDTEESEETKEGSEESTEEESEESAEDEDKEAKGDRTDPEAERKRQNDEMAKKRIAEREAREKAKREAQDKYLGEAENNHDLALRQLQVDAYNNRVLTNQNTLQNGLDKAVAHIDLFKTGTPEVKEALLEAVDEFEAFYVTKDRNGEPVEVKRDLFEFLQSKAESIRKLTGVGARTAKHDKDKTKSRTLTPPTRTPKQAKSDPDIDSFDEEAERW
jgi:hypothetical protein